MRASWTRLLATYSYLVVFVLACIAALTIRILYQSKAIVIWDEAHFMEWIYWTADAMRAGDWPRFWQVTYDSFSYPPLFNWIMSLPFVFTPPSIEIIRLTNLVFYILSALFVYLITRDVTPRYKTLAAVLSGILFLLSPMAIIYTTIVLREMMGMMFTLITVYFYIKSKKGNAIYSVLTSVCLILLTMVKYNFGLIIFIPMMIHEGIEFLFAKHKKIIVAKTIVIGLPYASYMYWWIVVYQGKLDKFIWLLQNKANYIRGMGTQIDYLLFYPRSILYLYSPSVMLGFIMIICFVVALWYLRNGHIRFMWIAVALNALLGTLHTENLQERYIFTVFPFLIIISVIVSADFATLLKDTLTWWRMKTAYPILLALVGTVVLYDLFRLPEYVYAAGGFAVKTALFNQVGYKDVWFDYNREHWVFPVPSVDTEKPRDIFTYIAKSIDVSKPIDFIGEANELSQPYRNMIFADLKQTNRRIDLPYSNYAVITDIEEESKFYTYDFRIQHAWKIQNRAGIESNPQWELITSKKFQSLGVDIIIYGKK